MISTNELQLIHNYASLVSLICVVHAEWVPTSKLFATTSFSTNHGDKEKTTCIDFQKKSCFLKIRSKIKCIGNYLYLSLNCFWTLLALWRVYYSTYSDPIKFGVSFQIVYIFVLVACLVLCGVSNGFAIIRKDLIVLFDQLLVCITREGNFNDRSCSWEKSNEPERTLVRFSRAKLFRLAVWFYIVAATAFTILFTVIEAHFVWTLSSSYLYTLVAISLNVPFTSGGATLFGFLQMYLFLYFVIIKGTLFRAQTLHRIPLSHSLLNELIIKYKALSILCNNFNRTYCRVIVPVIKWVCSAGLMVCILAFVRCNKDQRTINSSFIRLVIAFMSLETIIVLFLGSTATSGLWQTSMDYIWDFRFSMVPSGARNFIDRDDDNAYDIMRKYIKRVANSYQPLRFGVGGLYYMEKEAKLTLANFIVSGTANLLIAYK